MNKIKNSAMSKTTILLSSLVLIMSSCQYKANQPSLSTDVKSFANKEVEVYTTADSTQLRLTPTSSLKFIPGRQPIELETSIFINPNKTFQTMIGIGGAITDASAETFAKLPETKQKEFLQAMYDANKGIGYTMARTNIQSCDFSSDTYSYVQDGDKDLTTFSIDHDKQFRIPLIKKAIEAAGGKLPMFVSPWSPPAFMKDNHDVLKGGKLLSEYYQAWANLYVKFIKAYEAEGIPIWATSIQNEPMAVQRWESCIYTAEEERDFLKKYLGPTLERDGLGDKKIIVWDHNRDLAAQRANVIFDDPEASKYAWGIGYHWYETWSGGKPMFDNLDVIRESYPDKKIFFTEGCIERFDSTRYQYWPNGERYGIQMITDFNSGTVGWTDWNVLLDETGGPNHVGNFCFAPIHANIKTGELIYTPIYYYIGHFSKFVRLNAKRISTSVSRSNLLSCSFINEDSSIVTIVMNPGDKPVNYNLIVETEMVQTTIPAHAIQTLKY